MAKYLRTYWSNKIELPLIDLKRLRYFIGEELSYYNALVSGLAGPIRSMPDTIAKTAALESLLVEIARNKVSPRALVKGKLPPSLQFFQSALFDDTGAIALDDKMIFVAELLATSGMVAPDARRDIARAVIRETRAQSVQLTAKFISENHAMSHIIEALSPIEPENKRHVQIPRSAIQIVSETKEDVSLKFPYFETVVTVPKPSGVWHYAFIRVDFDGNVMLDLSQEHQGYVLRKTDRKPSGKRFT